MLQIKESWVLNVHLVYEMELPHEWNEMELPQTDEARNVQNCVNLWYALKTCHKLTSIELEMYTQYVDDMMNCAQSALQILKLGMHRTVWNYEMHVKRGAK